MAIGRIWRSLKEEIDTLMGRGEEKGAPLRIGVFFAFVNLVLRACIVFCVFQLVHRCPYSDVEKDCVTNCDRQCLLDSIVNCRVMRTVNTIVFIISILMFVFDTYVVARLPVTNFKRLRWMDARRTMTRAFLTCEVICCSIFLILIFLSVIVAYYLQMAERLVLPEYRRILDYQLAIPMLSMVSVFVYMFVDWCTDCTMPEEKKSE